MMSKYIIYSACYLLVFCGGVWVGYNKLSEQHTTVLIQEPIKSNTIKRDYTKMDDTDLTHALFEYDRAKPTLEIKKIEDGKYEAQAGLADREWSRKFEIESVKKNRIMAMATYTWVTDRFYPGGQIVYSRRYGIFSINGGFHINNKSIGAMGGIGYDF